MSRPSTIVVVALAGVGNALLQQPTVRQLARAFPDAKITIFARGPAIAAVFDRLPEVADTRVYGNGPADFARMIRDLRRPRADVLVVPYPSNRWQYSLLAAASGAKVKLINAYPVGYWRAMHFLVGNRVPAVEGLHDADQATRLLERFGVAPDPSIRPTFPLTDAERSDAAKRLPGRPVAIHAGSGATVFGAAKRWDPAHYATLIGRLRDEMSLPCVVLEGPDEAGVAGEIARHAGRESGDLPTIRLAGPLAEAAAVLSACRLYVGNDSGLGHLAAAVETPPVTLFGPARPDELCPVGFRHLVVQTPAPCAPCFRYPTRSVTPRVACRPPYCVNQITVEAVMAAVRRALSAPGGQSTNTAANASASLSTLGAGRP